MKRKKIAAGVLILVAVAILIFESLSERDNPVARGRRLSRWFFEYALASNSGRSTFGPMDENARVALEAIRALGTNALPWLVRQAFDTESTGLFGTNRLVWLHSTEPIRFFGISLPSKRLRFVSRVELCGKAVEIVSQLAVPADALLSLLRDRLDGNDPRSLAAIQMLGAVRDGTETILPYILRALQSDNARRQLFAIQALEQIGPDGKAAIPVLVRRLSDHQNNRYTRSREIALIGNFGPDARGAVPDLERIMGLSEPPEIRSQAAVALCQITGNHPDALALVSASMRKPEASSDGPQSISRDSMYFALTHVRYFGQPFVSILTELAERARSSATESRISGYGLGVLEIAAPEAAKTLLRRWMQEDPREFVRAWAANHMLMLDRTNEDAVAVLTQIISTNLGRKAYLISFLGEAASRSLQARKTLENIAATNVYPDFRRLARDTLRRIQIRAVP